MGFSNGKYAKVWKIIRKDNYTSCQISTSKKKGDKYETDFSQWVNFVGPAHRSAETLKQNDKIKLLSVDVGCFYNRAKKESRYGFTVFDYEMADGSEPEKLTEEERRERDFEQIDPADMDAGLPF